MNTRRRPPPTLSAEQFFTIWLPAEIARLGSATGAPERLVRVEIVGDEGGIWDLRLARGALVANAPDPSQSPTISLMLSVEDWRALTLGEEGRLELAPPSASPLDLLFLDALSQQLLSAVSGTFSFEVHRFNGRTWQLRAALGRPSAAGQPDAVIATDVKTYRAILARELSAPEAYSQRRITITGDLQRGMQVGLALLPKM
jgi:hypothetical protein